MKNCVIVANGEFTKKYKFSNNFIIACDGAYNTLINKNIYPNIVIGDMDSIEKLCLKNKKEDIKFLEKLKKIEFIKVNCQESNDLQKAFLWAILNDFNDIDIIGATGKREDHTLLNIGLMVRFKKITEYLKENIDISKINGIYDVSKIKKIGNVDFRIITDYGIFRIFKGSFKLESYKGQQISLFSVDKNAIFNSEGLKYPLINRKLNIFLDGALNEAISETFEIITNDENFLIVFSNY